MNSTVCCTGSNAAGELGYGPIKINAVAVKNLVEPDIVPLARFGRENGHRDPLHRIHAAGFAGHLASQSGAACRTTCRDTVARDLPLVEIPDADPRAPATEYRFSDGGGTVGFIASISRPFCLNCNRIRLTADGNLATASSPWRSSISSLTCVGVPPTNGLPS